LETIATRGERLVLYRLAMVNDGLMTEFLQIDRWNEAGLIDRQIRIDHGDLEAAMTELDRLWATSLTERRQSASRLAVALGRAWVAPSTHTFDDLLTGDFECVDGRTLGMGSLDRADFEQILRGREADGATGVPVPSRVEFVSDDVMVFRANNLGQAQDSGVDWEEIACNVLVFDDDRITRLEMFDEDHWDDAVARAKELSCPVRRPENPAARHRDVHITDVGGHDAVVDGDLFEDRRSVVSNEDGPTDLNATAGRIGEFAGGEPATALPVPDAQRLGQRVVDRIGTGDFEAARDCFEEGFLRIDQRRVIGLPDMDRDAYVDDLHRQWELGWQDFRTVGQIAVRDNAFSALLTTDFDGGSESPFRVLVVEGATGRIGRLVMYDEHDTQSADSDLDEAWLATLDPADAATYPSIIDGSETSASSTGTASSRCSTPAATHAVPASPGRSRFTGWPAASSCGRRRRERRAMLRGVMWPAPASSWPGSWTAERFVPRSGTTITSSGRSLAPRNSRQRQRRAVAPVNSPPSREILRRIDVKLSNTCSLLDHQPARLISRSSRQAPFPTSTESQDGHRREATCMAPEYSSHSRRCSPPTPTWSTVRTLVF